MTSSLFDPVQFLEAGEVTGEMATKFETTPLGRFNFQVKSHQIRKITPSEAGKDPFFVYEAVCVASGDQRTATGQTIKELTGQDEVRARYKGFADFTPQGAMELGPGKNVAIGKLRAAVGQNSPTAPWRFPMLLGQVFSGEVIHKPNEKNPEQPFAEIINPMSLS